MKSHEGGTRREEHGFLEAAGAQAAGHVLQLQRLLKPDAGRSTGGGGGPVRVDERSCEPE